MNEKQLNEIKEMYLNGATKREIINKFNLDSYHKVNVILTNLGILKIKNYKNKTKVNDKYLDVIDTEDKAYFVGFMLADGFLNSDSKKFGISLKTTDIHILKTFKEKLEYEGELKTYISNNKVCTEYKNTEYTRLLINSVQIYNRLKDIGLNPKKSKHYDLHIEKIPEQFRKDFLRGYFDGNCSIVENHSKGKIKYAVTFLAQHQLLDFIENFFQIDKKYYRDQRRNTCNIFAMKIQKQDLVNKILDILYKNSKIHLHRKYERYLKFKSIYNNKNRSFICDDKTCELSSDLIAGRYMPNNPKACCTTA